MATFDINPVTQIDTDAFNALSTEAKLGLLLAKLNELIDRNKTLLDALRGMINDTL